MLASPKQTLGRMFSQFCDGRSVCVVTGDRPNRFVISHIKKCWVIESKNHHTIADFLKSWQSPELYLSTWLDATLVQLAETIVRSAKLTDVQFSVIQYGVSGS
jgi:hypothetical protein